MDLNLYLYSSWFFVKSFSLGLKSFYNALQVMFITTWATNVPVRHAAAYEKRPIPFLSGGINDIKFSLSETFVIQMKVFLQMSEFPCGAVRGRMCILINLFWKHNLSGLLISIWIRRHLSSISPLQSFIFNKLFKSAVAVSHFTIENHRLEVWHKI